MWSRYHHSHNPRHPSSTRAIQVFTFPDGWRKQVNKYNHHALSTKKMTCWLKLCLEVSPLTFKSSQRVRDAPRDYVPAPLKPSFCTSLFSLQSWLLTSYLGWPFSPWHRHIRTLTLSNINYRDFEGTKGHDPFQKTHMMDTGKGM